MFGFGRSSNEEAIIKMFEPTFIAIGNTSDVAKKSATELFDYVKNEMLSHSPSQDIYRTNQGSTYAKDMHYMQPRLEAGLSHQDIESFWNRPIIVILCEMKIREMFSFMSLDVAIQQGRDIKTAELQYKIHTPIYGNPQKQDSIKLGEDIPRPQDADLFIEFANRIEALRSKMSDSNIENLISQHGTFNAMVRHLVSNRLM
jgi:hypothetical protein